MAHSSNGLPGADFLIQSAASRPSKLYCNGEDRPADFVKLVGRPQNRTDDRPATSPGVGITEDMAQSRSQFDSLEMPLAGVHSIAASAGTGKTYAITTLYVRYLLESRHTVDQILATTYTEAATAELKDRIRSRLAESLNLLRSCETELDARRRVDEQGADGQLVELLDRVGGWTEGESEVVRERLEDAVLNFDQAPIFTIHGFCRRILQELVFESGTQFNVELVASLDDLIEEGARDFIARWWMTQDSQLARRLKLTPTLYDSIREVASEAAGNPFHPIVPDGNELSVEVVAAEFTEFDRLMTELAERWTQHRDVVVAMLVSARGNGWLSKSTHAKDRQLEDAFASLDALVGSRSIDALIWSSKNKALESVQKRLQQSQVEKGTLKKFKDNTPRDRVFELMDEIAILAERLKQQQSVLKACVLSAAAAFVREHVERRKRERSILSFGDLLLQVDEALAGNRKQLLLENLRGRYHVAMVDEFQDTDPIQFRIFSRVFLDAARSSVSGEIRSFVMIGDPKQSIYRFRGADVHSYLRAVAETPSENRHEMGTNWRSDRSLVESVQAIFRSAPNPFLHEHIPLPEVTARHDDRITGPALSITFVRRPHYVDQSKTPSKSAALGPVVEQLVSDMVELLNSDAKFCADSGEERAIEPSDVAILCPLKWHLQTIQEALSARGIPSVMQTDQSVFETDEAQAVVHVLRAVMAPGRSANLAAAFSSPVFGMSASRLDYVLRDADSLAEHIDRFRRWNEVWHRDGVMVMWRTLLHDQQVVERLATQITGERQITNLLHVGELLHIHETETHAGPEESLRHLERQISRTGPRNDESLLRLETDSAAVQLVTIHRSKGLEFPIVFCPTLWTGPRSGDPTHVLSRFDQEGDLLDIPELDVGSNLLPRRLEEHHGELSAESRRLLYVALTRARHNCRLYWTAASGAEDSALATFLFADLPDGDLNALESDEQIESALANWKSERGDSGIEIRVGASVTGVSSSSRYEPRILPAEKLAFRPTARTSLPHSIQTSFTGLTRFSDHRASAVADRDELSAAASENRFDHQAVEMTDRIPLADMPGGARIGNLAHRVLEDVFSDGRISGLPRDVVCDRITTALGTEMSRVQLDPKWESPLAATLTSCLTERLLVSESSGRECRLVDLPLEHATCELQFLLKLGSGDRHFSIHEMARAFERSETGFIADYSRRIAAMSVDDAFGFLAGFIDVVFEFEGRWYILDYKTTYLGRETSDYSETRLREAMVEHDYVLQSVLYCVAVKQFLEQRIPGFDFDEQFGGVLYLFLRGFPEVGPPANGVYFFRPTTDLITDISDLMSGGVES